MGDKEILKGFYKMTATNKEGETKDFYEWAINPVYQNEQTGADAQSGAKFGLDPGIWKIEVTILQMKCIFTV